MNEAAPPCPQTLRDHFAGVALLGMCGSAYQSGGPRGWCLVNCTLDELAASAYELADAMLAARRATTGKDAA